MNRLLAGRSFSAERERKVISARVSFGATGAPTLDANNSIGVLSVVRQGVGLFTFQFGFVGGFGNVIEPFVKLLAIETLPDISYVTSGSTAVSGQPAVLRNDLTSGMFGSPPVQGALATSTSGGTLPATTQFFYKVTAVFVQGTQTMESLASNEQNVTTGAGGANSNTVSWSAVPGAVGYRVYRTTAGGGTGAENVVYVVVGGSTVSFLDTGAASQASAAQPTVQARPPIAQASLTIQFLTGAGAAVDPANGEAMFLQFDLGDYTGA